ncbi:MAG: hypothetical protein AAB386_04515 [Patescibacteria group bacterium]
MHKRIITSVAVVFFGAWLFFALQEKTDASALAERGKERSEAEERSRQELIAKDRKDLLRALKLVASGDEEGEKLIDLFQQAVVVRLYGSRRWSEEDSTGKKLFRDANSKVPRNLWIMPSEKSLRAAHGFIPEANFEYAQSGNGIFTPPPSTFTDQWLGVRLAHELLHANDYLTGVEPPNPKGAGLTDDFVQGEVRAHNLEVRLLDRMSNGAFGEILGLIAERYEPPAGFPARWFFSDSFDEFVELDKLFLPARSKEETNSRCGSYNIALNFMYAERLGLGEKGKAAYYRNMSSEKRR